MTEFGTITASLSTPLHNRVHYSFATFCAGIAQGRAGLARVNMVRRPPCHESGAGLANIATIPQQANVIARCVLSALGKAVNGGLAANNRTIRTGLNAIAEIHSGLLWSDLKRTVSQGR